MLEPRPFSYATARPPEGKDFAVDRLRSYASTVRQPTTADAKATLAALEGSLARQKVRTISVADQIKIAKGEMECPEHLRAAGTIRARVADLPAQIEHLKLIVGNTDAHAEALTSGLNEVTPAAGADHD